MLDKQDRRGGSEEARKPAADELGTTQSLTGRPPHPNQPPAGAQKPATSRGRQGHQSLVMAAISFALLVGTFVARRVSDLHTLFDLWETAAALGILASCVGIGCAFAGRKDRSDKAVAVGLFLNALLLLFHIGSIWLLMSVLNSKWM